MHIISAADFPYSARKCLILPAECSPQKSLILLEILPAELMQEAGADLGEGAGGAHPPHTEMTCGFLIRLVFCQKKKNFVVYWC